MRILPWLALAAGCGDGGTGGTEVEVEAVGAALVVVQDGDGAFRPLELDAQGVGRFEVTSGVYGIGAFCQSDFGGSTQHRISFFFDDEVRRQVLSCAVSRQTVKVSGTTAPDAEISVGQSMNVADATGAYQSFTIPGTHDVFAVVHDPVPRVFVARAVAMSGDTVVDLPLATAGVDLVAVTPTVTGASDAAVTVSSDLNTASTYVFFDSDPTTVHALPPSLVVDGDRPTISASARGCVVQQAVTVLAPTLALPSPFAATVERASASWTADASVPWDSLRLILRGGAQRENSATFFATQGWLTAAGDANSFPIVDVTTLEGWTPELGSFTTGEMIDFDVGLSQGNYDGELVACDQRGKLTW